MRNTGSFGIVRPTPKQLGRNQIRSTCPAPPKARGARHVQNVSRTSFSAFLPGKKNPNPTPPPTPISPCCMSDNNIGREDVGQVGFNYDPAGKNTHFQRGGVILVTWLWQLSPIINLTVRPFCAALAKKRHGTWRGSRTKKLH